MHRNQACLLPLTLLSLCVATAAAAEGGEPADRFLAALAADCGSAYAGEIVANEPAMPDDPFVGKTLVMHIRECGAGAVRVPFHVGEDRSRTWVITRSGDGLHLAHDHRHEDGSPDTLTMYGGRTTDAGTESRQSFPADAYSVGLFEREGRQVSVPNVWTIEFHPGSHAIYELSRPGRLFRVRFDLTTAVEPPPAPWGAAE
jgi:hypothetical protein